MSFERLIGINGDALGDHELLRGPRILYLCGVCKEPIGLPGLFPDTVSSELAHEENDSHGF